MIAQPVRARVPAPALHDARAAAMSPPTLEILAARFPDDLETVQDLAHRVWWRHYPGIITDAQIAYMLARGYSTEALAKFGSAAGHGLALARVEGRPAGFAAWYRADEPATTKLDKLYVLQAAQGHGVGRHLLRHVEDAARRDGSRTLILNVNKRNASSIAFYDRCGLAIREAVVIDIGEGHVMDDFIMAKALQDDPRTPSATPARLTRA
jgi:GNAT superfamily N-acetyltransferase